jgi:WD40 repeat protein
MANPPPHPRRLRAFFFPPIVMLYLFLAACMRTPEALPPPMPTPVPATLPSEAGSIPTPIQTPTPSPTVQPDCSIPVTPANCARLPGSGATDAACPGIRRDSVSRLRQIALARQPSIRALAFSPDDSKLAAASGDANGDLAGVAVQCALNGMLAADYRHSEPVWDIAFSPDGRYLAYASSCSNHACTFVRTASTGALTQTLPGGNIAYALAFSPDNALLALAGAPEEVTFLFSTSDWTGRGVLNPHEYVSYDLAFFPNGHRLAVAGIHGEVHFWDTATGSMLGLVYETLPVYRVSLSPDGGKLAAVYCSIKSPWACANGRIIVWNTATASRLAEIGGHVQAAAFSPDGRLLAVGSGPEDARLRFYDTSTWSIVAEFDAEVDQIAFSPDGRFLALADGAGLQVWGAE